MASCGDVTVLKSKGIHEAVVIFTTINCIYFLDCYSQESSINLLDLWQR
jgi:hypothetical protein